MYLRPLNQGKGYKDFSAGQLLQDASGAGRLYRTEDVHTSPLSRLQLTNISRTRHYEADLHHSYPPHQRPLVETLLREESNATEAGTEKQGTSPALLLQGDMERKKMLGLLRGTGALPPCAADGGVAQRHCQLGHVSSQSK